LDPDEESGWYIEEVIEGSTIGEVLAMTQWDKIELMRLLKTQVDAAIKTDFLKPSDAMKLLADYERLLQEYTYLSLNGTKLIPQHLIAQLRAITHRAKRITHANNAIHFFFQRDMTANPATHAFSDQNDWPGCFRARRCEGCAMRRDQLR